MRFFRPLSFICFILFSFFNLKANEKDSLFIKNLVLEATDTAQTDFGAAIKLFDQAIDVAKSKKLYFSQADALLDKGVTLFGHSMYDDAIKLCGQAAQLYSKLDKEKEIRCYSNIGYCYTFLNQYKPALETMFKGVRLAEESNNLEALSYLYTNISIAYNDIKDSENELKYINKALEISKKINNSTNMAMLYNNLGNSYKDSEKYPLSIKNFLLAIGLHRKMGNKNLLSSSLSNLSMVYEEVQKYDSALYYGNLAIQSYDQPNFHDYYYCSMVSTFGYTLVKANEIKEAKKYIELCSRCKEYLDFANYALNHYNFLSLYYSKVGDYKKAYENLNLLLAVKDSSIKESLDIENQKISIRYDFEQKAKVDSLNHRLELTEKENIAKSYKIKMYIYLSIAIFLIAFAMVAINRTKTQQRIKRREQLEKMRSDIAGDLHDDIGSTLSSIKIFSDLAIKQSEQGKDIRATLQQVSNLTNKIANNIREIVWSVNPSNDTIQALVEHLRKVATEIIGTSEIQLIFDTQIDQQEVKILPNKRKNIIMIFKEAINNARKYSKTNKINIHLSQKGQQLHLIIKDFGNGFDKEKIERGNGLNNMEKRVKEMSGTITIESNTETGTEINLKIMMS
ncbi:MAG: tetratricopeptide repeat protein [Chitinophagales bacterium]|nr:tetratricopeptide repeat protein [Chitinophagales bacterium]